MNTPPRPALLLLRLAQPDARVREGILGDLEEDLSDLEEAGTPPSHPNLWYWWAILGLSVRFALRKAAKGRTLRPTGGSGEVPSANALRREKHSMLETIRHDLNSSFRSLHRDPGLAAMAVAIVALGIGACSTVFSVANALLIRPFPFPDPEELVIISNGEWERGQSLSGVSLRVSDLWTLQSESHLLSEVAGYYPFDQRGDYALTGSGEPERLTRIAVTGNFLTLLGVQPLIGRLFNSEEVAWNGPGAILLTHGFWVRRFGGDPDIVGRTLTINDEPATVVGVLPPSFDFATVLAPGARIDFVAPFPLSEETDQWGQSLVLVARLKPGASPASAQSEAVLLAQRLGGEGGRGGSFHPRVTPLRYHVSGDLRSAVLLLAGAVGSVMLIVCTNLSNLLLARGATRGRDMAIRAALGAERRRLIRQLLAESGVLASAGSLLGLGLTLAATRILSRLDSSIPLLTQVRLDGTVVGFSVGMALVTGVAFGLAPAIRLSGVAPWESLKESGRGQSTGRRGAWVRSALVVSQVGLCCMLLVGAGLLVRSFGRILDVDLGFRSREVIAFRVDPSARSPWERLDPAYYMEALQRVRSAPGIKAAGLTDILPTAFNRTWGSFRDGERAVANVYVRVVSEGFLDAMGLSLLAGRDLLPEDDGSVRTRVLVNEVMAERLWPEGHPVGRTLSLDGWAAELEVVGVVRGTRYIRPEQPPGPEIFFSIRQNPYFGRMYMVARGSRPAADLTAAVRSALRPTDPLLPLTEVTEIQEILDRSLSPRRFLLLMVSGFAGFALFLAALGLHGVISFSVTQRTQEMGIRTALGASPGDLMRRVLSSTLALAGMGMTLGLVAAWMLGRVLQGLLFGVQATDPVTYLGTAVLVVTVAALAGFQPARRATRVDPVRALGGGRGTGG